MKWLLFYISLFLIVATGGSQVINSTKNNDSEIALTTDKIQQSQLEDTRDVIELRFNKTGLVPTKLETNHDIVVMEAVTLTFEDNLFDEKTIRKNKLVNQLDRMIQKEKLFYHAVVKFENHKAVIIPMQNKGLYPKQTNWLIARIGKLFGRVMIYSDKPVRMR